MTTASATPVTAFALTGTSLGPYATGWRYEVASEVRVVLEADGVETLLTSGQYVLTGATPLVSGGSVTLNASVRPEGGWGAGGITRRLILRRATVIDQPRPFGEVARYQPAATEDGMDQLTRVVQDQRAAQARMMSVPEGEAGISLPTIAQRSSKIASFDSAGKLIGERTLTAFDINVASAEANAIAAASARNASQNSQSASEAARNQAYDARDNAQVAAAAASASAAAADDALRLAVRGDVDQEFTYVAARRARLNIGLDSLEINALDFATSRSQRTAILNGNTGLDAIWSDVMAATGGTGAPVVLPPVIYELSDDTELDVSAGIRLNGQGATLRKNGLNRVVKGYGSLGTIHNLASNPVRGALTLTMSGSEADNFEVGGTYLLRGQHQIFPGAAGTAARAAEFIQVRAKDGNTLHLFAPVIWESYALGGPTQLQKVNWGRYDIRHLKVVMDAGVMQSEERPAVELFWSLQPKLTDLDIGYGRWHGIQLLGCVQAEIMQNHVHDLDASYGYGVQERGPNLHNLIGYNRFSRVRTGYTTGFGYSWQFSYGAPVGTQCVGNNVLNPYGAGVSAHPAGYGIYLVQNHIQGAFGRGINVRAPRTFVVENRIWDCVGVGINLQQDGGALWGALASENKLMRTNLGVDFDGNDARELGAIHDNGPDSVIIDNRITDCGGPMVTAAGGGGRAIIEGNKGYNPCQLSATNKFAIGALGAGVRHVNNNSVISTDAKLTEFMRKQTGVALVGKGNSGIGIAVPYVGERANYWLSDSAAPNAINLGQLFDMALGDGELIDLNISDLHSANLRIQTVGGPRTLKRILGGLEGSVICIRIALGSNLTLFHGADETNNIRIRTGANLDITNTANNYLFKKDLGNWVQLTV